MQLISTTIRLDQLPDLKAALFRAGITTLATSRVNSDGFEGDEAALDDAGLGLESQADIRVEMACPAAFAEPAVRAILSVVPTDSPREGRVFIRATDRVISISTGREQRRR